MSEMDADKLATQVAEQYLSRLRVFAVRRLRNVDAAEDVAQETLRRVLEALRQGRIRDLQALPGYVFETARHVCLHVVRDTARERIAHTQFASLAGSVLSRSPDALDSLLADERRDLVKQVLAELDPADRELIELSYETLLSADQIGERLGLTATNVRVRRHRILRRIAVTLRVTDPLPGAPEE